MFAVCADVSERGSVSRSSLASKTGLGSPQTQLAGEHAAGHRPALLSVPAAPDCVLCGWRLENWCVEKLQNAFPLADQQPGSQTTVHRSFARTIFLEHFLRGSVSVGRRGLNARQHGHHRTDGGCPLFRRQKRVGGERLKLDEGARFILILNRGYHFICGSLYFGVGSLERS